MALVALVLLVSGVPAAATQVVLFKDGRTMPVERVQRGDETAVLILEGGGEITVPSGRIANWWELDKAAPRKPTPPPSTAWRAKAGQFADLIGLSAERHDLDPVLLTAVADVESAFNPKAVSHKGAQGLLQLMPKTAERFGVRDSFDVSQNIDAGARYLKWLLERYQGSTELALAGYNAGEAAVDRYDGIPPYRETENYVTRVLERIDRLSRPQQPAPNRAGSRRPGR